MGSSRRWGTGEMACQYDWAFRGKPDEWREFALLSRLCPLGGGIRVSLI